MEADLGSLILATDISRQNEYLSRFRMHLDQEDLCLSSASHRHFVLQVRLVTAAVPGSRASPNCADPALLCLRWP